MRSEAELKRKWEQQIRIRINYSNLEENRKKWKTTKTKPRGLLWLEDKTRGTYTMDEQKKINKELEEKCRT